MTAEASASTRAPHRWIYTEMLVFAIIGLLAIILALIASAVLSKYL